ncbi:hypothetical protein [Methylomicrobium lacus]|uniref:hypothetical protein n=1 Tax=Methylomicrobium lacus TaxID=136992 RepID=UPI00045EC0A9|nr:hypothetical protein [Methylomicrobium lacus]
MLTELTFYDPSGKIYLTYSGQNPGGQKNALSEYAWIEGSFDGDTYYIDAETPIIRPAQTTTLSKQSLVTDGVDAITISGAPVDAKFTAINMGTKESVTGIISGTDTFSTTVRGAIRLKVEKFPYLTWEATINAV